MTEGRDRSHDLSRWIGATKVVVVALAVSIFLSGCVTAATGAVDDKTRFAVETYAKAAFLIQDGDWVEYEDTIEEAFTPEEFAVLDQYQNQLEMLIGRTLGYQHSVYGAKLAGYFQLGGFCYLHLRQRILKPRGPYYWEGSSESDLAKDQQFQYQFAYIEAIRELRGTHSLAAALELTEQEMNGIRAAAEEYPYWTKWMFEKLESNPVAP